MTLGKAFQAFQELTNGHDVTVKVQASALAELIDRSFMPDRRKDKFIRLVEEEIKKEQGREQPQPNPEAVRQSRM